MDYGSKDQPFSFVFKYIIIGDSGIGKSSILQAYTRNAFDPEMVSTIGIEFGSNIVDVELKKDGTIHKDTVKIQIWDTAGQERFQAVTGAYYRGSVGVFIVYDITRRYTFDRVKMWYNRFLDKNQSHNTTQFIIIGNKSDKDDRREITYSEGKELADSLNASFFETSCRFMINIDEVINEMTQKVYSVALDAREDDRTVEGIRQSRFRYFQGHNITKLGNEDIELIGTGFDKKKKCCR